MGGEYIRNGVGDSAAEKEKSAGGEVVAARRRIHASLPLPLPHPKGVSQPCDCPAKIGSHFIGVRPPTWAAGI